MSKLVITALGPLVLAGCATDSPMLAGRQGMAWCELIGEDTKPDGVMNFAALDRDTREQRLAVAVQRHTDVLACERDGVMPGTAAYAQCMAARQLHEQEGVSKRPIPAVEGALDATQVPPGWFRR